MVKCILGILLLFSSCSKKNDNSDPSSGGSKGDPISAWFTSPDQTKLLQKQTSSLILDTINNPYPFLDVDSTVAYQSIDGFGYTLTGGSAYTINRMSATTRAALLNELFAKDSSSISVSYLRLSIGASDLNASVFSYDDLPAGQTDTSLTHFSLGPDSVDLIPLLKQILAINPAIKIIATPWSAPVWMKDNQSSVGGSLLITYYDVYARYFVKYINEMKSLGITIDAITPQNEPLNPNNNPSLYMTAGEQSNFIKNNLGPAFASAGLSTKIIVYDHNCDVWDYATNVLNDPATAAFVDGSAFHLYAGSITALTQVHNAFPSKNLYFTEQYTATTGTFAGDLQWHMTNVVIGSMNNWSRNALEWNLATDPSYGPHTDGGCTTCKAALTVDGSAVTRNVAYYIIAQASKFVPPGSVRIKSSLVNQVASVAFQRPDGKKVLLVMNNKGADVAFNIRFNNKWVAVFLPAGTAATYVW